MSSSVSIPLGQHERNVGQDEHNSAESNGATRVAYLLDVPLVEDVVQPLGPKRSTRTTFGEIPTSTSNVLAAAAKLAEPHT